MTTPTQPDASALSRPDGILIQFESGSPAAEHSRALEAIGGRLEQIIQSDEAGEMASVRLGQGVTVEKAIALLSHLPGVKFAEPDYLLSTQAVSNDTAVAGGSTWGLYGDTGSPINVYGSQATEAWAAGYTGTTKTAVGVVDTGIDYTHPDLYLNIWLNQREIPTAIRGSLKDVDSDGLITFRDLNNSVNGAYVADKNANGRIDAGDLLNDVRWENGLDEDANGYKDDLIGWDWKDNDNDPMDTSGHGTHVSGTIGGVGGNGAGVAGVNWSTQIVALKFMDASGGYTSAAVQALDYFTKASQAGTGVDFAATNNSWGGGAYSQSLLDAITRGAKQNILFVAAAGNGGSDSIGDNNDSSAYYPSAYSTAATAGYEAVIAVGALGRTGALATFSNYGAKTVDIAAPGEWIYSTLPGGTYGLMQGTSMATPHVAGAIALYSAYHGAATAAQIRAALLGSTISTSALIGKVATGGRLDIGHFLGAGSAPVPPPPTSSGGVTITGTTVGDNISNLVTVSGQKLATAYADTISGLAGNDTLNGGGGADSLVGGTGDDTYVVDNSADKAVEAAGAGNDLVQSSVTFTLGANVERLTITGSSAVNGTGNELANTLTGNGANNSLSGGAGNDNLNGGYGNDTLSGGDGNDHLDGSYGDDLMQGGAGDDTYVVNSTQDVVSETLSGASGGNDMVTSTVNYTLGANVETLWLSGMAVTGVGNTLANSIQGNGLGNRLDGGAGNDTLSGRDGADTLLGGAGADALLGGTGNDRFVLAKGQANGDSIHDFAAGDIIQLTGYSAGSTLSKVAGSTTDWVITDGSTHTQEILHLLNGYALRSSDFLFG